jgi:hypothetical protein
LLVGACESRDLLCEDAVYFQVLQPDEGGGTAPFSIERLGPEVKSSDFDGVPAALRLTSRNRAVVDWESYGLIVGSSNLIFWPIDGFAQNAHPDIDDFYPMKHFTDGALERVRFGFRPHWCPDPDACLTTKPRLYVAAELTCHREF